MKRTGFIVLILIQIILLGCEKKKIEKGVSLELAQARKKSLVDVRYGLILDIPESPTAPIIGKNYISFEYKRGDEQYLYLDFSESPDKLKSILVNRKPQKIFFENEHIAIPTNLMLQGINVIEVDFIAGDLSLNRNPDFLYTLFVPDRASTCFPSFDQPDIKASINLELRIPKAWEAVTNQSVLHSFEENDKMVYQYTITQPISTYQFAFAAGKFKKITDEETGMTMYYRENDSVTVAANVKEIFSLHKQSLAWMEAYTDLQYPFLKFDFALIPDFQYGGMEHPGSIFYKESSLMLDAGASINQKLSRANLIAHETAHMWFGNLVTMKWFNDVWLKEVFANFMASKIVNPLFPEVDHELKFLMDHYPSAYAIDRSEGSHPIQQELNNLKHAGTLYGAIIYQKAPIMMRNLESYIGEENFKTGLRDYLKNYNYSNASWDDLMLTLALQTDKNLAVWNNSWIKGKGMPVLEHTFDNQLHVKASNSTLEMVWPQLFQYQVMAGNQTEVADFDISKKEGDSDTLTFTPEVVIPNYKGRGYGYFRTDEASRKYMLANVNNFKDPAERAAIWLNLWEYVLRGELRVTETIEVIVAGMGKEKNSLILEYLSECLETLFWQFTTPDDRIQLSARLDDTLFELMALEKNNSLKRVYFNCYKKIVMSPEGIENLKKFWRDEMTLGLNLSETDHIQLAYELAVRDAAGSADILIQQLEKTNNPDRKNAMRFVMPALSSDEASRDNFFESLKQAENRAHEPWVLEALTYLHHPLRSAQSVKYIQPSLAMLEEIQFTGDIFFPKGWVERTLANYQSKEAADAVRQFLAANPTLSDNLKNKLLQSADLLFRAEKILYGTEGQNM